MGVGLVGMEKKRQMDTLVSGVQVEAGRRGFTASEKCLFVLF